MRVFVSQLGCYGHGGDTSTGSDVGRIASDTVYHFMKEQIQFKQSKFKQSNNSIQTIQIQKENGRIKTSLGCKNLSKSK